MSETLSIPKKQRSTAVQRRVSLAAYFRAEEKTLSKNEFHDGIVIPMAGAKLNHNRLAHKAAFLIESFIEEQSYSYIVSNSDTKIRIEAYNKVVYPDAVVICEKPVFFGGREDTIMNPLVVVEVMSASSEVFDRSLKFDYYRTIESFKEYVLLRQEAQRVTVYTKQPDATWILRDYTGPDATAILYALHNCPLPLKRLYAGIEV
jgi:Uma2 family endonuclease